MCVRPRLAAVVYAGDAESGWSPVKVVFLDYLASEYMSLIGRECCIDFCLVTLEK